MTGDVGKEDVPLLAGAERRGAGLLGTRASLVWKEKKKHQRKPMFPAELLSGLEGEDPFNHFLWVGLVFKKMHLALGQLRVKWQQGF